MSSDISMNDVCKDRNSSLGSDAAECPYPNSHIPRPTGTVAPKAMTTTMSRGLRRSGSLGVRGEQLFSYLPPVSTATSPVLLRQRYPRCRHSPVAQECQQRCQNSRQNIFPVITENGTDSPRQRSLSLSLTATRPRVGYAASGTTHPGNVDDSDADSVKSFGSACSTASACEHATFALNGTTWSGRSRKYVVHCYNQSADNEQYLTPTQRATRQIRKLQALLKEARKEIEDKDREIFYLTKEVVELRLYKASLNSPDDKTDSSDALTVRENNLLSPESPPNDLQIDGSSRGFSTPTGSVIIPTYTSTPDTREKRNGLMTSSSITDSGHLTDELLRSVDTCTVETQTECARYDGENGSQLFVDSSVNTESVEINSEEEENRRSAKSYEVKVQEIQRQHIDELQELKQKHSNKVEGLLNQLADVNTRYCEVKPTLDAAEARVRQLESELEVTTKELAEQKHLFNEQEERHKQMYLKMYAKGQEAARIEHADQVLKHVHETPTKVTVAELLHQLTVTQSELENIKAMYRKMVDTKTHRGALDLEITLQFLKSAVYYFLTDKENHHGHLNAIESILGFTEAEKNNIAKIYGLARK